MQFNRVFLFTFQFTWFFATIGACQKQAMDGFSTSFIHVCRAIDAGYYDEAFKAVESLNPKTSAECCEQDFLRARIFFAEGAFFLAEDLLNKVFSRAATCPRLLLEKTFLLRGDVYYQMLELERSYENTIELGRFWQRHFPNDEQRKAVYHTLKAQYFAALIKSDSAKFHTANALKLYRKNKVSKSQLPLWTIYANHVACLRNGLCVSEDLGEEKMEAYSDTCKYLLNSWFPKNNVEKSRAIQALSMIYFDRIASFEGWIKKPKQTALNFSKFLKQANYLTAYYINTIGPRHPYHAQIQFLIGLANHHKKDTLAEYAAYKRCIRNSTSTSCPEIPFILNWRRYFSVQRFFPFLESELVFPENKYAQLNLIRKRLERNEELFYLRYFYMAILSNAPVDDVYSVNPFLDLEDINIDLFKLTGSTYYRNEAWAAVQKVKYTDLLRHRYRELNFAPSKTFLKQCNRQIGEMRLLNDSILLCSHRFESFKFIQIDSLVGRLNKSYKTFRQVLNRERVNDPLAGKFLHGKEVYTIQAVQRALAGKQAAWVDISQGGRSGTIYTMIWYITADSVWMHLNKEDNSKNSDLVSLSESLQKRNLIEWKQLSYEVYSKSFKRDFDALKAKNIKRIFYSPDQNSTSFSPEMLVTDTSNYVRPHFLAEDFAFSTQLVAPTELQGYISQQHELMQGNMFCYAPKLPSELGSLPYSRKTAESISERYNLNLVSDYCSTADFAAHLKSARLVQVFSHGEGEKGIWLSDRLISPAEIRTMQIHSALISLTTCESYNGKLVRNEGVRGMVEAFSRAGAKRIIASLWKIDEIASSQIMEYFYEELFNATDPDLALQRAKLRYLASAHPQEMHPYFWAGMALFGEPTGRFILQTNLVDLAATIVVTLLVFAITFFLVKRRLAKARYRMRS